jgi:hypothetical protein
VRSLDAARGSPTGETGRRQICLTVIPQTSSANHPCTLKSGCRALVEPLASAWRQTFVDRQPFLDAVEGLPVAGVDRHLALAVLGRIIERSGLEDDGV